MAGAQDAVTRRDDQVATPLPVVVSAAGLVSGVRFGPEALARSRPQLAQFDAIRTHYQEVAEWIDHDAAGEQPAVAVTDAGPAGRMSSAGVVDYLGFLDSSDDVDR
ncbi:MAG: MgtC/SapB family protein, partial [Mycobacteriaceae bacterium]|nr:MgtC/SapB family protein [Mycobacteriaceae bacterium]